ncbi:ribosome assembly cofactor RimP [Crocinitomicaceae bacterium CZZ-1]|uniref:Ribosome maturation factor RimP n=1 Tax=Taishania pollutisoli TaxID=2766479 RepID=A0A8J6PES0_9FLAO|nr:ribosome assembly cofactor RimP [Taishania pollutisoli]MBC9812845.1 ribosome assembly cofactor RimP [Taishania pollutisoli]MBX2949704.1 ribosome assembly cofactor RimP [Crocinitomicaceae bacterium]NGF76124.1 ribosome assembly cofactor RimP [Fluviicola sp. SGL-29]
MISKARVEELINERIAELNNGLFVVELSISSSNVINVELDKHEGGVSVEDCMSVSRNIEHNLDREQQDFELNVSSAGLDRPLRVLPQYRKNIGRTVKVVKLDGVKLEGTLVDVNEERIVLEKSRKEKQEGKKKKEIIVEQHELPFSNIKETKIVISFK